MSVLNEFRERSWSTERCGWWVRFYLGHTSKPERARAWRSDLSRGVYIRPWADRAIGIQWRRVVSPSATPEEEQ